MLTGNLRPPGTKMGKPGIPGIPGIPDIPGIGGMVTTGLPEAERHTTFSMTTSLWYKQAF